jgi:hypothetical protein
VIAWIDWLSPIRVLFHRQFIDDHRARIWSGIWSEDRLFLGLGLNAVVMFGLWLLLRYRALQCFSDRVGRAEPARDGA